MGQSQSLAFPQAIHHTESWLGQWQEGTITSEVLAQKVALLLSTSHGRRGFFVVALAGPSPLLDHPPTPILEQLRRGGAGVVDLVVRNLAMGTAMALEHQQRGNGEQAMGSLQVQRRAQALLSHLDPVAVDQGLHQLLAATEGRGPYRDFLQRWNYDTAQCQAIAQAVRATQHNLANAT